MTTEPLLGDLDLAAKNFLAAFQGVSETQWTWKPGPGIWSLQEVAEHTCVVQKGVERLFTTQLLEQPFTEESAPRRWTDHDVAHLFDAPRPARAPEMVHPKGRWTTPEQMAEAMTGSVARLSQWVRASRADLRGYGSIHPLLGMLDGVQWLIFAPGHIRHHTRQLAQVQGRWEVRSEA